MFSITRDAETIDIREGGVSSVVTTIKLFHKTIFKYETWIVFTNGSFHKI